MTDILSVDYLVVGAGATAMAFIDTMLDETDATFAVVDRYDQPGGHWRKAYQHVHLHQPSQYYGVNSAPLGVETYGGSVTINDASHLSSLDEIKNYFEVLMRRKFVASGRVTYFPMTEFEWDTGVATNIVSGRHVSFDVKRRTVDSTYMKVTVPATTPPSYAVDSDVRIVPPNSLPELQSGENRYVVIGAGKTGVDAVLWLLENNTDPDRITWVRPRDPWMINRDGVQPGPDFDELSMPLYQAFIESWLSAETQDELLDKLENAGWLFRIDPDVRPRQFRCATVSSAELELLRKVRDVTSREDLGRVTSVSPGRIEFERGVREIDSDALYVDCTANGLTSPEPVPVFQDERITLQSVVICQQVFSAAFIAHIEARFGGDDEKKNSLTQPVLNPSADTDFVPAWLSTFRNEQVWNLDEELIEWRQRSRLAGLRTKVGPRLPAPGPERDEALAMFGSIVDFAVDRYADLVPHLTKRVAASTSSN